MKKTLLLALLALLAVVQAHAQGKLWGLSTYGGQDGQGAIFRASPDGTGLVNERDFELQNIGRQPSGDLVLAGNGKLYGVTEAGGPDGHGILFEYDPTTNAYTKQFQFNSTSGSGPRGSLRMASNNKLYGTTELGGASNFGVLFSFDPASGIYTKIIEFNGTNGKHPYGSLAVASNGKLYGMTNAGGSANKGVLFEFDPVAVIYNTMFSFTGTTGSNPGSTPYGSLASEPNGKLYGVTYGGGTGDDGVLFEYDPAVSAYSKKYDFDGTNGTYPFEGLTLASNNKFYGTTNGGGTSGSGVIYEFDPAGAGTYTKKIDFNGTNGGTPYSRMALGSNNKLYGMTEQGGTESKGVLFEYDPASNAYTKKVDFNGATNGGLPRNGFVKIGNGKLYGLTTYGGAVDKGVLFEFDPATSTYTKKLDFNIAGNGREPGESLVMASNNKLYGTAAYGGASDLGVLYEFDPITLELTKKVDFNGTTNGRSPLGRLIEASNGKLYGVTFAGGNADNGVLYEFNPATSTFTKKVDFSGYGVGITLGSNNKFYGTTSNGGANSFGVLFEYDPATSTYTKKLDFAGGADGSNPVGSLVQGSNGKFYGLMYQGGTSNFGVLYEYDLAGNTYTKKADFTGTNGRNPRAGLTQASNEKLYGTVYEGGASSVGVLFEFDPASGVLTKKLDFASGANGKYPRGGLTSSGNNKLYGMTTSGGTSDAGVLFEYDPATNTYTKKSEFSNDYPEGTLLFEKAGQVITFDALASKTAIDGPFNLTATATSSLTVSYASSNPAVATVSGNTLTIVGAGTTTITASQAGNSSHKAATAVLQTLTVNKVNQTITFAPIANKTVGDATFNLTATTTSPLTVSYASSNTAIATVSGNAVTIVGAGTTTITASQAGNVTYNAATDVPQTLTVDKLNQTISFTPLANKTVGDAAFNLTATTTSPLTVSYASSNTAVATVLGNTVTIVGAGTTTISASQAGNATYNAATDVPQTLTVDKLNQTISFTTLANKTVGDAAFNLTATTTSPLTVSYASSNTAVATVLGNTLTIVGAGITTLTASQAGDATYNAATAVPQTLTVSKINQTVTFAPLANKTVGDATFNLTATTTSPLIVSYASSNTAVATVSGNVATIVGAGTTTITASQAGNATYNAAIDVPQTLLVNKADQTITFAVLPDKTLGDAAFTLSSTSTSSLAVSFSTVSDKLTIVGNQVTLVKAGRATIKAAQVGNSSYNEAVSVERNFCIKPAKPTITKSNNNSESPTLTSSSTLGNQWFLNGTVIVGATSATYNVTTPGVYQVLVKVDDCASELSSEEAIIVTGDMPNLDSAIGIFPNPVSERITVQLGESRGIKNVALYQLNGKQMDVQETTSNEAEFNVTTYSDGIYIVRVKTEGGMKVMRFVKH